MSVLQTFPSEYGYNFLLLVPSHAYTHSSHLHHYKHPLRYKSPHTHTHTSKVQEMNARLGTSVAAPELPAGPPTDSVVEGSASELPAGPATDPPVEGSAPEETATKPDAGPADGVHAEPASRDPADDKKAASPAPASEVSGVF